MTEHLPHHSPGDQRRSVEWARRVLQASERYVVLDTETTGLEATSEVIQLCLLDIDGNAIINTLLRPRYRDSIPWDATRVHGITMDMLKDAPTYPEIATDLIARTQGRTIICYNAEYDSQLLRQTAQINGGRVPSSRWECVMLQYARFRGEWNFSRRDYRWHRLPGADHTALGDCRATLALVYQMARAQKLKRWYEFWVDSE